MTTTLDPPREEAPSPTGRPGIAGYLVTTDHKKIGILYCVTAFVFFVLAGLLALGMRAELATPDQDLLSREFYNESFTIHGSAMLLLFLSPFLFGLANYFVPLQIGAPDMAFPRMNATSYWFFLLGGICFFAGFTSVGGAGQAGWTAYAPLSGGFQYPGTGFDLWLGGMVLTSIATMLSAVNFAATVVLLRAPGMTMWRMPIFTWEMLVTSLLVLAAFPSVAMALIMVIVDRHLDGAFFDASRGGDPVMYQHLFWFFGHPEVYILILPAFGIITEVVATFSRKPVFGYRELVLATVAIAALAFGTWAHHMYTTGAVSGPFFAITTSIIAIPTGIKLFNWLGTMWGGHITWSPAMLFAVGMIANFLIGGITGVILSSPPLDYHVHDTYFVVSHFHYVLMGGAVFAVFAGIYYWFPKMSGFRLNDLLGKLTFWAMFIGFNLTFFPQFIVGMRGMPRRVVAYPDEPGWQALNIASSIGALLIAIGVVLFIVDFLVSARRRVPAGDDPWEYGQTLEWATSSPPPEYNFDGPLPPVRSNRPTWDAKWGEGATPPAVHGAREGGAP